MFRVAQIEVRNIYSSNYAKFSRTRPRRDRREALWRGAQLVSQLGAQLSVASYAGCIDHAPRERTASRGALPADRTQTIGSVRHLRPSFAADRFYLE